MSTLALINRSQWALLAFWLVWMPARAALADNKDRSGTLLAVDLQLSPLHDGLGLLIGLSAGWQSPSGLRFGGALYDLLNGPLIEGSAGEPAQTKLHYLGAWIGQQLPIGAFGVTADLLVGAGDVAAYRGAKKDDFDRSWFFVVQPTVGLDLPRLGVVQMRVGTGYRFATTLADGGTDIGPVAGPLALLTTTLTL